MNDQREKEREREREREKGEYGTHLCVDLAVVSFATPSTGHCTD